MYRYPLIFEVDKQVGNISPDQAQLSSGRPEQDMMPSKQHI